MIKQGPPLVDDSSKRTRGKGEGLQPVGDPLSANLDARQEEADSILKLLNARLELPDLADGDLVHQPSSAASTGASRAASEVDADRTAWTEPSEMTPTPMVVANAHDGMPVDPASRSPGKPPALGLARRGLAVDEGAARSYVDSALGFALVDASSDVRGLDLGSKQADDRSSSQSPASHAEYHPPRKPPTSVAPPPAAETISVASEYDPRAPTKPKVRRNSSVPPHPLWFGLDRMLIWGMILGGLFVAAIIIIVHQLALTETMRPTDPGTNRPLPNRGTDVADQVRLSDHHPDQDRGIEASGRLRATDRHDERGAAGSGAEAVSASPVGSGERESTILAPATANTTTRPSGSGGKGTPRGAPRANKTQSMPLAPYIQLGTPPTDG
jgi:hypothetical protein